MDQSGTFGGGGGLKVQLSELARFHQVTDDKSSFKLKHQRTSTTLSEHVWKFKKNKTSTSTSNGRSSKK